MASYARGIYDYYDVERIEEFVAFKGAYEIESLFEKYEDFDDQLIDLKFLPSLNIAMIIINTIMILMNLLRNSPLSEKRLIFCRSLWKKELMKL